jgi:SAM-dependent MidA family methyltransferase
MDAAVPEARRERRPGTIIETCPGAAATVYEVAGRLVEQGGAALFIDYGHDAVRAPDRRCRRCATTARSIPSPTPGRRT